MQSLDDNLFQMARKGHNNIIVFKKLFSNLTHPKKLEAIVVLPESYLKQSISCSVQFFNVVELFSNIGIKYATFLMNDFCSFQKSTSRLSKPCQVSVMGQQTSPRLVW